MSLHADALASLEAWAAPDASQEALRLRYVAHLRARPDGMDRSCRPDHLTASTLVLDHDRTHVLLTLHAKARRWFQLGGHGESGDATLAGAALREATEESGVDRVALDPVPLGLDEHEVPFCAPAGGVLVHHLDVRFVAVAPAGATYAVSEESLDLRWWPVAGLPPGAGDLRELVARAVERTDRTRSAPSRGDQSTSGPSTSSGGGATRAAADQPRR